MGMAFDSESAFDRGRRGSGVHVHGRRRRRTTDFRISRSSRRIPYKVWKVEEHRACFDRHPSKHYGSLGGFLAVGVQMRLERPGKAGIVTAVDTIEPPVVKLRDGSVVRVE